MAKRTASSKLSGSAITNRVQDNDDDDVAGGDQADPSFIDGAVILSDHEAADNGSYLEFNQDNMPELNAVKVGVPPQPTAATKTNIIEPSRVFCV